MVDSLNSIICQAADISIKKVRYTDKNIKSKQNKKQNKLKWFDQSLVGLRRQLEQKQKLLDKYRRDPQIRGSFFSLLKKYRKVRKLKYKEYKKNLFDQLDLLRDSDPKSYWSLLEKLNHLDKPSSSSPSDEIPEEEWFRYFKSLNKNNKNVDSSFLNKLKDLENVKIFTELDNRISNKEIINAIASLKNNKASSFDQILNEMLKFGQTYIIDPLCKLFNNILSTGKFPVVWAKGIIVPIFKSGEKCNPSNYRGITIGSCF